MKATVEVGNGTWIILTLWNWFLSLCGWAMIIYFVVPNVRENVNWWALVTITLVWKAVGMITTIVMSKVTDITEEI